MNRIAPFAVVALALSACSKDETDSGADKDGTVDTNPQDTSDDCGGTAPVVTFTAECAYPGLQELEQYDDPVPTIKFEVKVEDEDGDLDILAFDIFIDPEANGTIDEGADEVNGTPSAVPDAEVCNTSPVGFTDTLALPPGSVTYGEMYDWGLRATDHGGVKSEIAVITCYAPNEDGTEPTGGDDTGGGDTGGDDTGA